MNKNKQWFCLAHVFQNKSKTSYALRKPNVVEFENINGHSGNSFGTSITLKVSAHSNLTRRSIECKLTQKCRKKT